MDAKWVANLELSDSLTEFRGQIEQVRRSIRHPVPRAYGAMLDEMNVNHFVCSSM
jgi:hypothetical protein